MSAQSVSFTIRRPTPVSRQGSSGPDSDREGTFKVPALPRHVTESGRSTPTSPLVNGSKPVRTAVKRSPARQEDSSDEEEEGVDEIVTGFDQFGVQRLHEKKKDTGPLVIPALANKDWREIARKRKAAEMFVPAGGRAAVVTGTDGSVGGLGTRDAINSGPQAIGLVVVEKRMKMDVDEMGDAQVLGETKVETDDERAMRALLAKAEDNGEVEPMIDAIPSGENEWRKPATETDAFKQDVVTRPEQASLEDYERVPVAEFGAALLRGMGWKPGQAASRTRTGMVEPYLPPARPALLGIGAKEREALDDGSSIGKNGKKAGPTRPERRYVPVVKREREGGDRERDGRTSSVPVSRRPSRSPEPERRRDRDGDRERDKEGDRDRDGDRRRDYDRRDDRGDHRDRDRDRDRRDRAYDSDKDRRREKERRYDTASTSRNRDRR